MARYTGLDLDVQAGEANAAEEARASARNRATACCTNGGEPRHPEKLIRDRIPEVIRQAGQEALIRRISDEEARHGDLMGFGWRILNFNIGKAPENPGDVGTQPS